MTRTNRVYHQRKVKEAFPSVMPQRHPQLGIGKIRMLRGKLTSLRPSRLVINSFKSCPLVGDVDHPIELTVPS